MYNCLLFFLGSRSVDVETEELLRQGHQRPGTKFEYMFVLLVLYTIFLSNPFRRRTRTTPPRSASRARSAAETRTGTSLRWPSWSAAASASRPTPPSSTTSSLAPPPTDTPGWRARRSTSSGSAHRTGLLHLVPHFFLTLCT